MESLGSLRTASRVSDLASRDGFAALDPALREPTRRLVASRPAKNVGGIPRPNLQKVVDVTRIRRTARLSTRFEPWFPGRRVHSSKVGEMHSPPAVGCARHPAHRAPRSAGNVTRPDMVTAGGGLQSAPPVTVPRGPVGWTAPTPRGWSQAWHRRSGASRPCRAVSGRRTGNRCT